MTATETSTIETWMDEGPVLLTYADGVARLSLNRPEASNGMNIALMQALHRAVMLCHRDPRVRVVLLRGNGSNFCAGGDVREFAGMGEKLGDFLKEVTAYLQMAVGALVRLDAIVVTAVHGYAAGGGGLGLVCASDFVLAADSAKFMAGATRVGMAPDGGASIVLPKLIGFRRAMEILISNRAVEAQEAMEIGLVTRTVADDQLDGAASELALKVARGAPLAQSATKRLLWNGIGVETCLPEEARTVSILSATADAREGLAAVIERRKPIFSGR
jgi:2-(1,2-epoxy-1,2-dihydrophenyl)acetyl-CoA isomerase